MTVQELIAVLSRFDPDLRVIATWEGVYVNIDEKAMQVETVKGYMDGPIAEGTEETVLLIDVE